MMRTPILIGATLAAAIAMPVSAQSLSGVSDTETTIPYASDGGIRQIVKGNGDVLFMRDRTDHWYRVQTNQGCLRHYDQSMTVLVDTKNSSRFDRFSTLRVPQLAIMCGVASIRASEAPPQVDSKSVVTLD
ncbi:hypothetical protein [Sphingosinithalassobacter portus]|uniref:hypothetical protein n=1 Tax=Stakelama portus TaxID=2676234 RepID=UPI000D6E72FB|nr:hypothetical protein [Sphingosinithalassobacter portus]